MVAIADFVTTISGTYHIHALTYEGEGDYVLSLEIAEEPSGGGEVAYGETVEGMLFGGGQHGWTFDGEEGDVVSIAVKAADEGMDCYAELYAPDDVLLTDDDDSGVETDALIEYYTLPKEGSYRIIAGNVSDEPGTYELALELTESAKNGLVLPGRDTIILHLLADFVVQRVM